VTLGPIFVEFILLRNFLMGGVLAMVASARSSRPTIPHPSVAVRGGGESTNCVGRAFSFRTPVRARGRRFGRSGKKRGRHTRLAEQLVASKVDFARNLVDLGRRYANYNWKPDVPEKSDATARRSDVS
jgi:hypothetical protein